MLRGESHEAEASEASLTLNNAAWVIVTVSIQGRNTSFGRSPIAAGVRLILITTASRVWFFVCLLFR